jgi:hypothetical protein
VLKANPHVLVVWSTDSGLLAGADQKNTKFRVYAQLSHKGDESAASKALLRGDTLGLPANVVEACRGTTPSRPEPSANEPPDNLGPEHEPPEAEVASQTTGRFTVRTFADIQPRTSTWLLPGVLPDDDLVVLVGEEGIGKGLFSVDVIARVTRAGHKVLIIATEDDLERVLRPRLTYVHIGLLGRTGSNEGFTGGNASKAGGYRYWSVTSRTSHRYRPGRQGIRGFHPSVRAAARFVHTPRACNRCRWVPFLVSVGSLAGSPLLLWLVIHASTSADS